LLAFEEMSDLQRVFLELGKLINVFHQ
jgi:hypothetical protein